MISVIIPFYNVEPYISACVESVIRQTETDLEIILIDDGSRDRSGRICDELARKDSILRVIHTPHRGVACARNTGLEEARGEWIAFVDGDDLLHHRMLEFLLFLADVKGAPAARCSCRYFSGDAEKLFEDTYSFREEAEKADLCPAKDFLQKIFNGEILSVVWAAIYRKECFRDCRFDEGTEYEDNPFTVKLLHNTDCIAYADIPLYGYRIREGSITKTLTPDNLERMITAFGLQMRYTSEFFPDLLPLSKAAMWTNVMNHCIMAASSKQGDRKRYTDMVREFRKKYRFTLRELMHPGISFRRRVVIGLAGPCFFTALRLKKLLMR